MTMHVHVQFRPLVLRWRHRTCRLPRVNEHRLKNVRCLASALLCAIAAHSFGQGDPGVNKRIIEIGKGQSQVWRTLEEVSAIGPRLTTSYGLDRSMDWAMAKFRSYGCTNVHLEQWGEWPVGFERGAAQSARMVAPWSLDFEFTSPSWTPGTDGPLRGKAVMAATSMEDFNARKDEFKGAWVIAASRPRGAQKTEWDTAMESAGINGIVTGSRNELVITSGNYRIEWDNLPTLRQVIVRKSDMDDIMLALKAKRDCVLEINMEQHFIKGPRKNSNVIAEFKGTEKPDEVVIVSGHLDSWDGPGSRGTSDNGTGISVALEAARILGKAGAKPKRTIRFILWTGEEQGLFGSRAYVEAHKDEMSKISAVLVDDGGSNYEGGMTCTADMEAMLRQAQAPMAGVFPDMPFEIRVAPSIPRGGGSDHAPFNAVGVPGFFWFETGKQDYNFIHHTQHDHLKYAIPEYLVQSATNSAVMSYNLACADKVLPRHGAPAAPPAGGGGGGK